MSDRKIRMVAGPNGSGKSTLLEYLRREYSFPLGYCQNPDEIEKELSRTNRLDFAPWGLNVETEALTQFFRAHPLAKKAWDKGIEVEGNVLRAKLRVASGYFAAVLSDFMRQQWLAAGRSFTFETVMSGSDKVNLLLRARAAGYRTYLYYICTSSPTINLERVAVRVAQGGHTVPKDKIEQRYLRSLSLLRGAIAASNRAYLFDNSRQSHEIVGEFENGRLIRAMDSPPGWFTTFALPERGAKGSA